MKNPFVRKYATVFFLIGLRNMALGACLLITGKLFVSPVLSSPANVAVGIVLVVGGLVEIIATYLNSVYPTKVRRWGGTLVCDIVFVYLLVERLHQDIGLYGVSILLVYLIIQDVVLFTL